MTEQTMSGDQSGTDGQARHGYRNEVNWEGGSGRQPYGNRDRRGAQSPAAGEEAPQGNRAERSGVTQDQLERVKQKP